MVNIDHAPAGPFNPLDTARRLKAAGCDPAVADAVAGEFVIALGGLVTKADLDAAMNANLVRVILAQALFAGVVIGAIAVMLNLVQLPGTS